MTQNENSTREEFPTIVNGKNFIIYFKDDKDVMFEGNVLQFNDCFFHSVGWNSITDFAESEGASIAIEGDRLYNDLQEPDELEEAHDKNGALKKNGLYDAGGHILPHRLADVADFLDSNSKY